MAAAIDHAELPAAEPIEGDQPHDQREHEPVEQADDGLAADDPGGVDRAEVLRCERAHRHRHGLRPGIAAHGRDDRHEHGERHHLLDGGVEQADHPGGEDCRAEIDQQPDEAVLGGLPDGIRHGLAGDAAKAQNILRCLFLDDLDHVVGGDDAEQPLVGIDHGRRGEIVALEGARHLLLVRGDRNRMNFAFGDLLDIDRPL